MRKFFVFVCLLTTTLSLFQASTSIAQKGNTASKMETQNWLLEKLKNYSFDEDNYIRTSLEENRGSRSKRKDYTFRFNGTSLVMKYRQHVFDVNNGSYIDLNEQYDTIIVSIPVGDIDSVIFSNRTAKEPPQMTIKTKNNSIKWFSQKEHKSWHVNITSVNFSYDAETDLDNRIIKAFEHLKQFYQYKPTKEPF